VPTVFVCHCQAVTDKEVHAAVDAGARTLDEVSAATGASANCGLCGELVESIIRQRCASCPLAALAVA